MCSISANWWHLELSLQFDVGKEFVMEDQVLEIAVTLISPNPNQPRKEFDQAELKSLAESIKEYGLKNPITVFRTQKGHPEMTLIDGERRLRAAKLAGMATIQAFVRDDPVTDKTTLVDAIIANTQRSDLNPVEEAESFRRLVQEVGFTQSRVAKLMGKSQSYVSFRMRLLELEPEIQQFFAKKKISMDVIVINGLLNLLPETRLLIARRFAQCDYSVAGMRRALTRMAQNQAEGNPDQFKHLKYSPAATASGVHGDPQIIKLAGKEGNLPAWSLIEKAAEETCQDCPLVDEASPRTCGDCAAVVLIKRLARLAKA